MASRHGGIVTWLCESALRLKYHVTHPLLTIASTADSARRTTSCLLLCVCSLCPDPGVISLLWNTLCSALTRLTANRHCGLLIRRRSVAPTILVLCTCIQHQGFVSAPNSGLCKAGCWTIKMISRASSGGSCLYSGLTALLDPALHHTTDEPSPQFIACSEPPRLPDLCSPLVVGT